MFVILQCLAKQNRTVKSGVFCLILEQAFYKVWIYNQKARYSWSQTHFALHRKRKVKQGSWVVIPFAV